MDLVLDFLLLAASAAACLYCIVLNRRLKTLTDAKEGLGAGIAALSQSAEEMKSAVGGAKNSADEAAQRIERMLEEADRKTKDLKHLIDELSEMSASVSAHAESSTRKYVETLKPFMAEANETANRLLKSLEKAPVTQTQIHEAPKREAPTMAPAPQVAATLPSFDDDCVLSIDDQAPPTVLPRTGAAA